MVLLKKYISTIILAVALVILSIVSLFIGVIDTDPGALLTGNPETVKLFLISRVPRLLAILCTGIGLSTAGLIMQQLCMNKFVSPSTGATISSAQLGILLALVFLPNSSLWAERLCICGSDTRNMDFCMVYPAHSVQRCGTRSACRNYVWKCDRRHYKFHRI